MHVDSGLPAMPQEIFSYSSGQRRPVAVPRPAIPATPPASAAKAGRPWYRKAWIWLLASAILVGGLAIFLFREAGKWLVVEDPLQPSDVAVVLSGRMPDRAREAAELFRQGLVSEVWITRPADASAELRSLGIDFIGEPFYNQTVLIKLGVPFEKIRVLDDPIVNTQDEVEEIAKAARAENLHRVVIVTSKAHTRRTRLIWKKVVGADPAVTVHGTPFDSFDAAHWWRTTAGGLDVIREVLGIANTWAGFPLKHLNPQS
ncbi:MAG TPA: YdcF family protein [Candidatus Acidoferrales bacterium]|nr:YdcF family protein [Candidatus Acidoferrales bacterium]